MKIKLLLIMLFGVLIANAQTTHNFNWFAGIGPSVDMTIDIGDTVKWTWTDAVPHTVTSDAGSTESFDSGTQTGIGQTFSWTFTVQGANDYFCQIHGAPSMSGTITVNPPLGIDDISLKNFKISPNPAQSTLQLQLPNGLSNLKVQVYDILGKQIYFSKLNTVIADSRIDISKWNVGMYIVKVSSEHGTQTKRFIKQ